jgi:hypothetical protein
LLPIQIISGLPNDLPALGVYRNKLKISIMKTLTGILFLICFIGAGCGKNVSNNGTTKSTLTLSSQTVKLGQPLIVTTSATGSNLFTKWSVNPPANTSITTTGNQSVILFSKAGGYTITASYFTDSTAPVPYDSSSSQVTVTDSIYNDSTIIARCNTVLQVPFNSGDLITLTPVSYSDSGMVTFLVHTQNTYGNNSPSLGFMSVNNTGNTFSFDFPGINEFPCDPATAAPTPATGSMVFSGLGMGTYSISLTLNGSSYQGSIVASASSCTITWNYTSGIIISPLEIQIQ